VRGVGFEDAADHGPGRKHVVVVSLHSPALIREGVVSWQLNDDAESEDDPT